MASLFERPIAATPIQQFTQLPLQFIQASLDRRHQMYNQAKAQADNFEDVLAQTNALTGDSPRHRELLKGYDDRMNAIIEEAGGDYSSVQGSLDALTRNLKRDLNYGELGAINRNFTMAMKEQEDLKKRYLDGKINEAGYRMAQQQIGQFQTTLGESGDWGTFSGYQPSNVTDPYKALQDSVDEINAQYSEDGAKFIDQERIIKNVNQKLESQPGVLKSMQENWQMQNMMNGTNISFQDYYEKQVGAVVSDKSYKQVLKQVEGGADKRKLSGITINNVGMPTRTSTDYQGGTVPGIREALKNVTGLETTKEFTDYINSDKGKQEIAWIEANTGSKMPTSHADQVEWLENALEASSVGTIVTGDTPVKLAKQVVDDKGFFNTGGAIYTQDGSLLDADDILDIQGSTKDGRVAKMIGRVEAGGTYPKGTYVILGKDGQTYFQEPSDTSTLGSTEYQESLINMAKYSSTGRSIADLKVPLRDPQTQEAIIPAGNYETRSSSDRNSVVLYQNGVPMFRLDSNGDIIDFSEEGYDQ